MTLGRGSTSADLRVTEAIEGIYRVEADGDTLGYVHRVGRVYVALQGAVYNTAIEVGQSLDLETAAERVARSA